jgi:hypothetical protein
VFEDMALKRIIGLKSLEVTGGWRKLYNEKAPNWHSSTIVLRIIK